MSPFLHPNYYPKKHKSPSGIGVTYLHAMLRIGLIKEGKLPEDKRVALSPEQCRWLQHTFSNVRIDAQSSELRCFSNSEYTDAGIEVKDDLQDCNLLLGIKEVPVSQLIEGKMYMFFSHTKKLQPHNRQLLQSIIQKKITLTDYECLEHEDGQRIIGFGFFAGIVGAHNGMMAYGKRTKTFDLARVYHYTDYRDLIKTYFGLKLPVVKIVVAGSGRVATGVLEIMNLMDVKEVDADDYLSKEFTYPVYVHLKGTDLYKHKVTGTYSREDFHNNPHDYESKFDAYLSQTDILMNGTYWDKDVPCLFQWADLLKPDFRIQTIGDISDDKDGGIPCNLGDSSIENPVYGVDPVNRQMIAPYQKEGVDIMAVSNLPNELARDASSYFGDQLIKYVIEDLLRGGSPLIDRATIVKEGNLCERYAYMQQYANG